MKTEIHWFQKRPRQNILCRRNLKRLQNSQRKNQNNKTSLQAQIFYFLINHTLRIPYLFGRCKPIPIFASHSMLHFFLEILRIQAQIQLGNARFMSFKAKPLPEQARKAQFRQNYERNRKNEGGPNPEKRKHSLLYRQ